MRRIEYGSSRATRDPGKAPSAKPELGESALRNGALPIDRDTLPIRTRLFYLQRTSQETSVHLRDLCWTVGHGVLTKCGSG